MLLRFKKNENKSGVTGKNSYDLLRNGASPDSELFSVVNYFKFVFFSVLLIIPVFAIVNSRINRTVVMLIIYVLLVPVGFVHGVLMLLCVLV